MNKPIQHPVSSPDGQFNNLFPAIETLNFRERKSDLRWLLSWSIVSCLACSCCESRLAACRAAFDSFSFNWYLLISFSSAEYRHRSSSTACSCSLLAVCRRWSCSFVFDSVASFDSVEIFVRRGFVHCGFVHHSRFITISFISFVHRSSVLPRFAVQTVLLHEIVSTKSYRRFTVEHTFAFVRPRDRWKNAKIQKLV